jgi:signal transduction histidine kinase
MSRLGEMVADLVHEVTRGGVLLSLGLLGALRREQLAQQRIAELEARLAHLDDAAQASDRAKDAFLATLSHELRTPLNATLGWVQLLRRHLASPAERDRALDVIERNTRAQVQVVADLLDVSRLVTGRLELQSEPVALDQLVRRACTSLRVAAAAKQLVLEVQCDTGGAIVHGDAARLEQVFWNLIANAIKFTPPGGRIEVFIRRRAGIAEVAVVDTGAGIAPDVLPNLFRRFQQGDSSTTRRFGGLGLGLAIVRHLVELHGGTVRAHSPGINRGATFVVTLPQLESGCQKAPRNDRRRPHLEDASCQDIGASGAAGAATWRARQRRREREDDGAHGSGGSDTAAPRQVSPRPRPRGPGPLS